MSGSSSIVRANERKQFCGLSHAVDEKVEYQHDANEQAAVNTIGNQCVSDRFTNLELLFL